MDMKINIDTLPGEIIKGLAILRDGSRCQHKESGIQCKEVRNLNVHHIIHREDGGDDSPTNLITLCAKHHRLLHKNGGKNFLVKKLVDENYISYYFMASLLGLTQPAVSLILINGIRGLETAIRIKVIVNSILKTNYTLEQLFSPTLDDQRLLHDDRLYDLIEVINSNPLMKLQSTYYREMKGNKEKLRTSWDKRYADKGGVAGLYETLKHNHRGSLTKASKHYGVSKERIRQVKQLLFPDLGSIQTRNP